MSFAVHPVLLLASAVASLALLPVDVAWAQASARIDRVTVYPGLASVERSVRVTAGQREIVLDCLSPQLDLNSLRIDADPGLRTGAVSSQRRKRSESGACQASPLDARIRALEDRIATLNNESASHDLALSWLKAPGTAAERSAAGAPAAGGVAFTAWLATVQKAGQQALTEQRRLQREREVLERELAPLAAERDRAQPTSAEVMSLRIPLSAPREGTVRLSYLIDGPTWGPGYQARLEVERAEVEVERLALVAQNTGEDWAGVALRLSTGSPRGTPGGPVPRRWEIGIRPQPQPIAAAAPRSLRLAAAPEMAEAKADDSAFQPVQQSATEFATVFDLPGTHDIASGNQRVTLSLGSARWPAQVKVQTTPHLAPSAWLVAEVQRPDGNWPDGPLRLLRDGQVVGQAALRLGQRTTLTLPFGLDERIRVQVNPGPQRTGETGFFGTRAERRITRSYTVENRRGVAVLLEVLEAGPLSTDERIAVTRKFEPNPRDGDWQDQPGIVAWVLNLAPGASQRFTAEYTISHPRDLAVFENR
ncbi:MAG: mucoidy inhibitor MuiA family protein [Rubrivivax sp.]